MFDKVLRELRKLEQGDSFSIDIELDDERYFDRVCPNSLCASEFKVFFNDWRDKVLDESVYCPICGFIAGSTEWNTQAQNDQIKGVAIRHVQRLLGDALLADTRSFNQSQRSDGLIKMSMSYRPGHHSIVIPARASVLMNQKSTCDACGCHYASVGAAFFCPACGHNSACSTFDASVETVRKTIEALPEIRKTLIETTNRDTAQDSVRHICENGLVKLVSAFQRLAEALYQTLPSEGKDAPRTNVFQNLRESSALWAKAIGFGYDQMLDEPEMLELERFFQQRHLLVHSDGLVDQRYLDRSGDKDYVVGQRLIVREDSVNRLAKLVSSLSTALRQRVADA